MGVARDLINSTTTLIKGIKNCCLLAFSKAIAYCFLKLTQNMSSRRKDFSTLHLITIK